MKSLFSGIALVALMSAAAAATPSFAQSNDSTSKQVQAGDQTQSRSGGQDQQSDQGGAMGDKAGGAPNCDIKMPAPGCPTAPGAAKGNGKGMSRQDQNNSDQNNSDQNSTAKGAVTTEAPKSTMKAPKTDTTTQQDNTAKSGDNGSSTTKSSGAQSNDTSKSGSNSKSKSSSSSSSTTNVTINTEQKTEIRQEIKTIHVAPVTHVDFNISVGIAIPKTVHLAPLPPRVISLVPEYRDFLFFVLDDGRIVIVDPHSLEIVYIVE